jgi:hypothetical protein
VNGDPGGSDLLEVHVRVALRCAEGGGCRRLSISARTSCAWQCGPACVMTLPARRSTRFGRGWDEPVSQVVVTAGPPGCGWRMEGKVLFSVMWSCLLLPRGKGEGEGAWLRHRIFRIVSSFVARGSGTCQFIACYRRTLQIRSCCMDNVHMRTDSSAHRAMGTAYCQ